MSIDKKLIRERFEARLESYDRFAEVQRGVCVELIRHLEQLQPKHIERIFEVGAGSGLLTKSLAELYPEAIFFLNDLSHLTQNYTAQYAPKATYYFGDAEQIEFPENVDLIASTSTIQWFEDVERFVRKAAAATAPYGILALSTFGVDNFKEVRQITGQGLKYTPLAELTQMIKNAGYKVITAQESIDQLIFSSPTEVLRHMQSTGVNSLRKQHWGARQLSQFEQDYTRYFSTPNGVTLTYHPIIIIAKLIV